MSLENQEAIPIREDIKVSYLIEKLRERIQIDIEACAGDSYAEKKLVTEADLHRPGLALAGYTDLFTYQRIQIIGNTECNFLRNLSDSERSKTFEKLVSFDLPVVFITSGNDFSKALLKKAEDKKIPVYRTEMETTKFMYLLRDFLEDYFAVQTMLHGTMVDVYGIGILISGKSGQIRSDCFSIFQHLNGKKMIFPKKTLEVLSQKRQLSVC